MTNERHGGYRDVPDGHHGALDEVLDWKRVEVPRLLAEVHERIDQLELAQAPRTAALDAAVKEIATLQRAVVGPGGLTTSVAVLQEDLKNKNEMLAVIKRDVELALQLLRGTPEKLGMVTRIALEDDRKEQRRAMLWGAAGAGTLIVSIILAVKKLFFP